MDREQQVLNALRVIIDPDLGKDIVTLNFIKNLKIDEDKVAFTVELTTPACPIKERFKTECERVVKELDWVESVVVTMSARSSGPRSGLEARAGGLSGVQNILAVSSCKGGGGKSTTAVNLAYSLAATGARVGIFDADIYGPSLPVLVRPETTELYQRNELIQPLEWEGVKLMSFGFIPKQPGSDAAIMRGPMVTQVINQLLTGTEWGDLDYLVLDLPPGTGDVQLTLTQVVPITAAVIVTTPQQLSFIDVVKGIQMFEKLKVPTVAVIENMSWFQPEPDGEKYYLFGKGAKRQLVEEYGFEHAYEIPVLPELAESSDAGRPVAVAARDSVISQIYRDISGRVVQEISKLNFGEDTKPRLSYNPERGIIMKLYDGTEHCFNPVDVRMACRGANTVDEFTGELLIKREDIPEDLFPQKMAPMGNYAVAVEWSHGQGNSIYPYDLLMSLAEKSGSG